MSNFGFLHTVLVRTRVDRFIVPCGGFHEIKPRKLILHGEKVVADPGFPIHHRVTPDMPKFRKICGSLGRAHAGGAPP